MRMSSILERWKKRRIFDGTNISAVKETSDIMAFRIASSIAFKNACREGAPILLEPIMTAEVLVPEAFTGEVISDLSARQGKIEQIISKGPVQAVTARVPLSKMFGYSTSLRSVSQGRGTFSMQFSHFDRAWSPPALNNIVIASYPFFFFCSAASIFASRCFNSSRRSGSSILSRALANWIRALRSSLFFI